jgi:hypothetical protein
MIQIEHFTNNYNEFNCTLVVNAIALFTKYPPTQKLKVLVLMGDFIIKYNAATSVSILVVSLLTNTRRTSKPQMIWSCEAYECI